MRTYKIEVHAIGYEDYTKLVQAETLAQAKRQELYAKAEWCKANDVDEDTVEMPFTRTTLVH